MIKSEAIDEDDSDIRKQSRWTDLVNTAMEAMYVLNTLARFHKSLTSQ